MSLQTRLREIQASTRPPRTQGKALSGLMSILKRAMQVNTLAEVKVPPIMTNVTKVKMATKTDVVAQK